MDFEVKMKPYNPNLYIYLSMYQERGCLWNLEQAYRVLQDIIHTRKGQFNENFKKILDRKSAKLFTKIRHFKLRLFNFHHNTGINFEKANLQ